MAARARINKPIIPIRGRTNMRRALRRSTKAFFDPNDLIDGDDFVQYCGEGAVKSDTFPFESLMENLFGSVVITHRMSRRLIRDLIRALQYIDPVTGKRFDPADLPTDADHFHSKKIRKRLALRPVYERKVPVSKGSKAKHSKRKKDATALVADVPLNIIINSWLQSPERVKAMLAAPGGHVMSNRDRELNRVPDEHVLPVPTA